MAAFVRARRADLAVVVELMRAFYAGESLVFGAGVEAAAARLLEEDALGVICLMRDAAEVVGYFVLTYGYSVERGGRFGLIDELYVVPAGRGRGLGKAAIERAAELARAAGCATLHLEADRKRGELVAYYERAGFANSGREYLTRRL